MATPRYSRDESNSLLKSFAQRGYTGWYIFDLSADQHAFWKALAQGIIDHGQRNYPAYRDFLTNKWRPNVTRLLSLSKSFYDSQGNDRFANRTYWSEIGTACMDIAIDFCRTAKKEHLIEMIRGGNIDFQNKAFFEGIAEFLNLNITIRESTSSDRDVTHVFSALARNQSFGLCVDMGKFSNFLYLLYHQNSGTVGEGFPFIMRQGEAHPLTQDSVVVARPAPPGPSESDIIRDLVDIIEVQARMLLISVKEYPPKCREALETFKTKINTIKPKMKRAGISTSLELISIDRLLEIPSASIDTRGRHTIFNCESFREDSDYVEFHMHSFHRSCLKAHLESQNLQPPSKPRCPIADCTMELPDDAITISASLSALYQTYRSTRTATLTNSLTSPALSSFSTMPVSYVAPSPVCYNCKSPEVVKHGCAFCFNCAARFYHTSPMCPVCKHAYPSDETKYIMDLRTYYQWA